MQTHSLWEAWILYPHVSQQFQGFRLPGVPRLLPPYWNLQDDGDPLHQEPGLSPILPPPRARGPTDPVSTPLETRTEPLLGVQPLNFLQDTVWSHALRSPGKSVLSPRPHSPSGPRDPGHYKSRIPVRSPRALIAFRHPGFWVVAPSSVTSEAQTSDARFWTPNSTPPPSGTWESSAPGGAKQHGR